MTYSVYNQDGTKRTEWPVKSSAIAAARSLKKSGIRGLYVVNERNAEIAWNDKGTPYVCSVEDARKYLLA